MARGWESKSVEAQQEELWRAGAEGRRQAVVDERGRDAQRKVLALARARTAADLEKAGAPAQREMLERALVDLDRMIVDLSATPS